MIGLPLAATTARWLPSVFPALAQGSFWLPPRGSSVAEVVDYLFYFILAVAAFFFLLIVSLMVLFVVLYRRRAGRQAGPAPSHNTILEVTWTVVPLAIIVVIFYTGFTGYMEMRTAPRGAYEIRVKGQKWQWFFTYSNGHVDGDLHVPVDQPVLLTMSSADVIHSLFIPAFRMKMDLVPGRYTTAWFRATQPGRFDLYCAEYCGTGHSDMLAKVVVHPPGEFEQWLARAADFLKTMPPAEAGEVLYRQRGCGQCHSTDGTARVGPSLKGIYGHTATLSDGTSVEVDDNYIRQSLLEPQAKIVAGYQPNMPMYKGLLNDDEINALIEFIKSLK